jgi:hypothetical protein
MKSYEYNWKLANCEIQYSCCGLKEALLYLRSFLYGSLRHRICRIFFCLTLWGCLTRELSFFLFLLFLSLLAYAPKKRIIHIDNLVFQCSKKLSLTLAIIINQSWLLIYFKLNKMSRLGVTYKTYYWSQYILPHNFLKFVYCNF